MAFIESNLPPYKVFLRKGFLFDDPEKFKGEYVECVLISIKCLPGKAALFQVLTNNGKLRDKLPIWAFCHQIPSTEEVWNKYPFHCLQLWDCFSSVFSILSLSYLSNSKVEVLLKNKEIVTGNYDFTIQWAGDETNQIDTTLAEDWTEHKSHHMIRLDNGLFALQPNNRILHWSEPSFVTKEESSEPWKINTMEWHCEQYEKWSTEDSDNYFYKDKK